LQRAANRLVVFDGGVVLLDNFGRVRLADPVRPEIIGRDWSDRDFFRSLLDAPSAQLSDITNDGPNQSMVVVVSVPITGERGELVGALAGMFRLGTPTTSSLYASIVRLRLGQGGNTYVIDGQGRVLYDSGSSAVGSRLNFPELSVTGMLGQIGAVRTRDVTGNSVVAAFAPVPGSRWTLVTEDDWNALTASVRRYGRWLAGLLAIGTVLPALGAVMLLRHQHAEVLERERAQHEMRVAAMVQERVLPRQLPVLPGWELAVHYHVSPVGYRDFYDAMFRPDGSVALVLGRSPEGGLEAAHVISTTRAIFRGAAQRMLSPAETLDCCNTLLCPEIEEQYTVGSIFAVLDPRLAVVTLANAGQPLPRARAAAGVTTVGKADAPLGQDLEATYSEIAQPMSPGDCLILVSPGLLGATNRRGETFGDARLATLLATHRKGAQELADTIGSALDEFAGDNGGSAGDVTVMALARVAPDAGRSGP
jgi:serine phosphatase RsbU (regulator of sigma subunit)